MMSESSQITNKKPCPYMDGEPCNHETGDCSECWVAVEA